MTKQVMELALKALMLSRKTVHENTTSLGKANYSVYKEAIEELQNELEKIYEDEENVNNLKQKYRGSKLVLTKNGVEQHGFV